MVTKRQQDGCTTILDKIVLKAKTVTKGKEEHYTIMKKFTRKDITIYEPNIRAPNIYKANTDRTKGRNRQCNNKRIQ